MLIVSGSLDSTIRIWSVESGETLAVLRRHDDGVSSVAFSHNGLRVASSSYDSTIRVWDVTSAKTVVGPIQGHTDEVWSIAYSPDGLRVVSGAFDNTVRVWNAQTGEELWKVDMLSMVISVAYSCDGKWIAAATMGELNSGIVHVLDAESGKTALGPLTGHDRWVLSVAFSPDGKKLASGSFDRTVRLWNTETGVVLDVLRGHRHPVYSIAFSPDGKNVASASLDDTVRIRDTTGEWKNW